MGKNIEIERRWLVDSRKVPDNLKRFKKTEIVQAYISLNPVVRIRKEGRKFFQTIKIKSSNQQNIGKLEIEPQITKKQFKILQGAVTSGYIKKNRYYIPYKKLILELDEFISNPGFYIVEIEFKTEDQAQKFSPLPWFGREITKDKKLSNVGMAYNMYYMTHCRKYTLK